MTRLVNTTAGMGRIDGDMFSPMWPTAAAMLSGERPSKHGPPQKIDTIEMLAPSPRPEKVICVGLNYRQHAIETGMAMPKSPVLFAKFANSIVGPDKVVTIPSVATQIDYEAELAVIIGRLCSNVSSRDALAHVAGYTCANDLSARDLQFENQQWMPGKAIDDFLPLGPALVTPEEVGEPQALAIRCWVNGELRQDSNTRDMIFSVSEIISFVSRTCTLVPGDVVVTGTPSGVGMGFNPPKFLVTGDEVVVEIERVGRLTTVLTDDPAASAA